MSPQDLFDALLTPRTRLAAPVWAAAAAALSTTWLLRAARLRAEWQPRTGATFADCLRLFLVHNAAVVWLPMRSGEAGYALWLQRRWQVPLQDSLPSLLWLRLQDAVVLALLSALTLTLAGLALPALAALGLAAVLLVALIGPAERAIDRLTRASASERPAARWARWRAALLARRGGRTAWLCSLGNWTLKLATLALLLEALGGAGPGGGVAALHGVIAGEWAGVLPVQAPGGLGSHEAAVWAGAGRPQPAAAALSAVVQVHALSLGLSSLGAVLALGRPATDTATTGSTT